MAQMKTDIIRINWFDVPTQVSFYELEQDRWIGGIGYHDEIICAECGAIIELEEMYDLEVLDVQPNPVRVLTWVDISDEIKGDFDEEEY